VSDRLEAIADRYKRQVAGRYRPLGPDELGKVPPGACHSSPKIDGELWLAELADGKASLFARGGRTLEAPPLLKGLAAAASKFGRSIVVAGELHVPRDGSRPRVGDVASALAARKFDRLAFHLFDVVEADGQAPPASYADRLAMLREAVPEGEQIRVVETESHEGTSGLAAQVSEWIDSGKAEGLIVRTAAGEIFKVKPSFTIDAAVIAFTVRATEPDQVRSVLLGLVRPDGLTVAVSACGNFPGEAQRRELLATLQPLECESSFRHSSRDGTLYRFVQPRLVIEVTCSDLQFEDTNGDAIRRWAIRHEAESWRPVAEVGAASLIHPVMTRVREDKQADATDARIAQLEDRMPPSLLEARADAAELPPSTVLLRRVWTKPGKSGVAVRKVIAWKSGKEQAWTGWPAWVVHFTDYSPDRKTPLERTMRTAVSEAEAMALVDALIEENIKKGWEPVGEAGAASSEASDATETATATAKRRPKKAAADATSGAEGDKPSARSKRPRKRSE